MSAVETTNDDEDSPLLETPIDVDQAFRDAEYQLSLLHALDERASRLQRNTLILVLAAAFAVVGLAAWVFLVIRPDAKMAIAGHFVDVIGTLFTLAGIVVGLLGFMLALRERVRTQQDYIRAEAIRLTVALKEARHKLLALQHRIEQ